MRLVETYVETDGIRDVGDRAQVAQPLIRRSIHRLGSQMVRHQGEHIEPTQTSPQVIEDDDLGSMSRGGGRESNPPDGDRPSQPL
jgi:hypothetical protein